MSYIKTHLLHRKCMAGIWAPKPYLLINLFVNTTQKDVHKMLLTVDNSIGNVVTKILVTVCAAVWVLEKLGRTLCKVYDCVATMLYTCNEYRIILNVNYISKIKRDGNYTGE